MMPRVRDFSRWQRADGARDANAVAAPHQRRLAVLVEKGGAHRGAVLGAQEEHWPTSMPRWMAGTPFAVRAEVASDHAGGCLRQVGFRQVAAQFTPVVWEIGLVGACQTKSAICTTVAVGDDLDWLLKVSRPGNTVWCRSARRFRHGRGEAPAVFRPSTLPAFTSLRSGRRAPAAATVDLTSALLIGLVRKPAPGDLTVCVSGSRAMRRHFGEVLCRAWAPLAMACAAAGRARTGRAQAPRPVRYWRRSRWWGNRRWRPRRCRR